MHGVRITLFSPLSRPQIRQALSIGCSGQKGRPRESCDHPATRRRTGVRRTQSSTWQHAWGFERKGLMLPAWHGCVVALPPLKACACPPLRALVATV